MSMLQKKKKKTRKKEKGTTKERLSKKISKFVKLLEMRAINAEIKHSMDKNKKLKKEA